MRVFCIVLSLGVLGVSGPVDAEDDLQELLERTAKQVSAYVDVISKMTCTERVIQLKLDAAGKTVVTRESSFDYLILLNQVGSDLELAESRLPIPSKRGAKKEPPPLLLSNGLSLLFLVFHPYYAPGFEYSLGEKETLAGRQYSTIRFRHIRGTRSPAALALRGREYLLDVDGMALIDPDSGSIVRIVAGLDGDMTDIGLRKFLSVIDYTPVPFQAEPPSWLPSQVVVDVESRHQHWRNIHEFSQYKRFGVATSEQVKIP